MNTPFGLGAIHSIDRRDYPYRAGITPETLPVTYRTDTSMFPVLMQGGQESCVSHAWVRLLQIYWYKKTGKIIDFSPRFLHAYTSAGTQDSDGRDPRAIGNVLVSIGCCTTALLPNDVNISLHDYSFIPITQAMLDEAAQYKIPAYSFPSVDSYSIRHAIYHKGAVALLFQIGQEWWTPSWLPKDINPLRPPAQIVGGHEVVGEHWGSLDGVLNSWSDQWNEGGYGEYNFLNYQPLQVICIDDPNIDFNPSKFIFTHNLWPGMKNNDVKELQKRLQISTTGFFGTLTFGAVLFFQRTNGIIPTGFVGALTRAKLNSTL